ncbi:MULTISPECIES: hypothetical protein [unclassified Oceanispirochaeta]|uniref:hypothetical protein n=1 Tax=unclassified Oceanispirochaeta TaxID=2635722 RepID=UPI0011C025CE|nr:MULTISPECIES: hypothetical protein [unclassified Oceanispirochaeta]MBF9018337.1 hypothetical protein [Oceanispirochaeta sp. M2]NPD74802.1 hypothetical protein [Oceanispirochaeta sp. M1]
MKTNRRSDKNRSEKYSERAGAMLDQFHWEKAESHFLALLESSILTIAEIRDLTWAQLRNSYEGLFIQEKPVTVREEYLEELRTLLKDGEGFYGEELYGSDGSPRLFTKETMKNITKELDQFKG